MGYAGTCPRCGGHGSYHFSATGLWALVICPKCDGTGVTYLEDLKYCPECQGKGQIKMQMSGAFAVCQMCHGWGIPPLEPLGPRRALCTNCNGTGDTSLTTDPEPCTVCYGAETVPMEEEPSGDSTCQNCDGWGLLRSPETGMLALPCPVCYETGIDYHREGLRMEKGPQQTEGVSTMSVTLHALPCPKCAGHGVFYNYVGNATPCTSCAGSGKSGTPNLLETESEKGPRRVVCSNCNGLGYWTNAPDKDRTFHCGSCQGVGTVPWDGPQETQDKPQEPEEEPRGETPPGHIPCRKCKGGGCVYCNGTGVVSISQALDMCFGDTVPIAEKGVPVCQYCNGAGLLAALLPYAPTCENCRGTGHWVQEEATEPEEEPEGEPEPVTCPRCKGKGRIGYYGPFAPLSHAGLAITCQECDGTGTYPPGEAVFPGIEGLQTAREDFAWLNSHVAGCMAFRSAWLMSGAALAINWPGVQAGLVGDLRVAAHLTILPEYLSALGTRVAWLPTGIIEKARQAMEYAAGEAKVKFPTHWARCFDPEEAAEVQEP